MKYFEVEFKNEKLFMGAAITMGYFSNLKLCIGLFEELGVNEYILKIGFEIKLEPFRKIEYKAAASLLD